MRGRGSVERCEEATVADPEVGSHCLRRGAFLQEDAFEVLLALIERVEVVVVRRVLLRARAVKRRAHVPRVERSPVLDHAGGGKLAEIVRGTVR